MALLALTSAPLTATVSTLGAELQSLEDAAGGQWLHDGSSHWNGRAPVLFPVVGALKDNAHTLDGVRYALGKHGFARRAEFAVAAQAPDSVTLRLQQSEETLKAWPWDFRLDVTFALAGNRLAMAAEVTNTDAKPAPVSFGWHPAFRWPLPGSTDRAGHSITFAQDEPGPLTRIDGDGLIDRTLPTPVTGNTLALDDSLFEDDALIFLEGRSHALRFGPANAASPALHITWPGMPHLGIWTKPGAPYLCIEPWQGYGSPAGFAGSLAEKPGSVILQPGENRTFVMTVEVA